MRDESFNAASLLREAVRRVPQNVAFHSSRGTITFAELWSRIERFSGGLAARGFGRGDRALLMVPMSVELYVALLAVFKRGGIAVFVDPWVTIRTMARLAATSQPKAFLGTPKSHILRLFEPALRSIPIAPFFVRSLERADADATMCAVERDERALVTFTTGSSGMPKGVNRTHRILRAQHERLAYEFPAVPGDVDLCTFPVFALNNLALGIPTLIPPIDLRRVASADPAPVVAAIRRADVTTMSASPPLFDRLAGWVREHRNEMPPIRRILTGGAPVSDAQLRSWIDAFPGAGIGIAYGSSEAEPVAHITAQERLHVREGVTNPAPGYLAGRFAEEVRAKVIAIEGRVDEEVPRGEIGELIVTGDHVCRDYDGAGAAEATAENKLRDVDGVVWHRMGDTGYVDEAGRFWIAGRVHSTIRRGGQLMHPQLVEQAVCGDDARIRRAAAVGVNNRLVIVVESALDLSADVHARLEAAGFDCDAVVFTNEPLPLDPRHNSKIDYAKLKAWLKERGF